MPDVTPAVLMPVGNENTATDTPNVMDATPVVTTNTLAPVAPVTVTEDSYSDSDGKGYEPTFNNTVRTVIYVAGLVAAAVGLGFIQFGDPAVGAYVSTVAGIITGGFGVAYNPIRMANK